VHPKFYTVSLIKSQLTQRTGKEYFNTVSFKSDFVSQIPDELEVVPTIEMALQDFPGIRTNHPRINAAEKVREDDDDQDLGRYFRDENSPGET
jgi:hypothetical protein